MTYRSIFIFVLLLQSICTFSQSSIGFQFGYNNSDYRYIMNYSDLQATNALNGFNLGIYYQKVLGQGLSISPELHYTHRGFVLNRGFESGSQILTKINLAFVETAAIVKWGSTAQNLTPFFELGPKLSYRVQGSSTHFYETGTESFESGMIAPMELAFIIGGGFSLPVATTKLHLFLRYSMGLNNVSNSSTADITMRSQVFSFGTAVDLWNTRSSKKKYCTKSSCL